MVIVLMGAAASGKSTVGRALAADLGWLFVDGDDYHSPDHIQQMRQGQGLTDAQRAGWLRHLHDIIERVLARREHAVVACSALKAAHRDALRGDLRPVRFVHLKAPRPVLEARLERRQHPFAGPAILHSQLLDLEEPGESAVSLDATKAPDILVPAIRRELGL